ncbi:MAG: amine acid ABC transporter, permease protein, 3-TM region, His/Glu/Gln/Arg/opine family [halophilic archaeon J07HX5]|nr:MAG: amine acid ABC transporter, permease protein, 3-TM region, His/Glu/Gln/Arg/opine family [halophilic archaeon J07HX5]
MGIGMGMGASLGSAVVCQLPGLCADLLAGSQLPVSVAVPLQAESDWAFIWDNRETLLLGTGVTILLTVASILLGFLLGLPAGALEAYGDGWGQAAVSAAGVVLRATPIVVLIVLFFFGLPIPSQLGAFPGLDIELNAFLTATLALGLRSAAYQSQVFRGTIQSVSEGQLEAARSIGLSGRSAVLYVVLPQRSGGRSPDFKRVYDCPQRHECRVRNWAR